MKEKTILIETSLIAPQIVSATVITPSHATLFAINKWIFF